MFDRIARAQMGIGWIGGSRFACLSWLLLTSPSMAQEKVVPSPTFSPSQETVLLFTGKMVTAAEHCDGITIDDEKLTAILRSAGIAKRDMYLKQRSASLQVSMQDYAVSFKGHRDEVCAAALAEGRREGLVH